MIKIVYNYGNILEKIKLISAKPDSVQHFRDSSRDIICFYIKGSMVDYILDKNTREVVEGSTNSKRFSEYWRFIRYDNEWILDEIYQNDEVDTEMDLPIYFEE